MGDTADPKNRNPKADESGEEGAGEGVEDENLGTVAVESKTVGYVIMNPDFYKEPRKSVRITGPSSAYEYITRKPRG